MRNATTIKDPILEQFLKKAEEMERHAGTPSPQPKKTQAVIKTTAEKIKDFESNPLRYFTVTDFGRAIRSSPQKIR